MSVHTVNERLRHARRKLQVTSSKEAARLLFEVEGEAPHFLGHKNLGEAGEGGEAPHSEATKARIPLALWIGGSLAMTIVLSALALLAPMPQLAPDDSATAPAAVNAEIEAAAREWLALLDAGDWDATYAGTANAVRQMNSGETWAAVSQQARGELGALQSRILVSQEFVPAPPNGYHLLRFRSDFANRSGVTETLTLTHEDGGWKVSGILMD